MDPIISRLNRQAAQRKIVVEWYDKVRTWLVNGNTSEILMPKQYYTGFYLRTNGQIVTITGEHREIFSRNVPNTSLVKVWAK